MPNSSDESQELVSWFIKLRLQNGVEKCYPISASTKDRLWGVLPRGHEESTSGFVEFDSLDHRILLQPSELVFFQFLFEPRPHIPDDPDEKEGASCDYPMTIYFMGSPDPVISNVYVDEPNPSDEGDEGEISNFLFYALFLNEDDPWLHFTMDSDTSFFRGTAIALIEVPHTVFEEIETDEDDED